MNIPNILSVFRLFLIPVFVVLFFTGNYMIAAGIFLLAGFTDILDGYIARKYDLITDIGKVLDPLADKLMQVTVVTCMVIRGFLPLWFLIVILVKEFSMIIASAFLYKREVVVQASWYGKVATALFYVIVVSIIFFKDQISQTLLSIMMILVILVLMYAFIRYVVSFIKEKHIEKIRKK